MRCTNVQFTVFDIVLGYEKNKTSLHRSPGIILGGKWSSIMVECGKPISLCQLATDQYALQKQCPLYKQALWKGVTDIDFPLNTTVEE